MRSRSLMLAGVKLFQAPVVIITISLDSFQPPHSSDRLIKSGYEWCPRAVVNVKEVIQGQWSKRTATIQAYRSLCDLLTHRCACDLPIMTDASSMQWTLRCDIDVSRRDLLAILFERLRRILRRRRLWTCERTNISHPSLSAYGQRVAYRCVVSSLSLSATSRHDRAQLGRHVFLMYFARWRMRTLQIASSAWEYMHLVYHCI